MAGIDAVLDDNGDISFGSDGDILTADQLDTAILMSLQCERRASASEMPLPELRRGWIGNVSTPGFEMGSKLWLYEQARVTRTTLNGLETEAMVGLQWLIDDGLAVNITVSSSINGIEGILQRPNSQTQTFFYNLWEGTGVNN
jgi:phage gp46-like protein